MERNRNTDSRLLSKLYLAADGDLDRVRKRYISRQSTVPVERLQRVRSILETLVDAMHRDHADVWTHVERAADQLAAAAEAPRTTDKAAVAAPVSVVSPPPRAAGAAAPSEDPPPAPWAGAPSQPQPAAPMAPVQIASAPLSNMTVSTMGAPSAKPLPFQGQAHAPSSAVPDAPGPGAGSTASISGGAPSSHMAAPVPFGSGGAVPTLTVQQYAQLWGRLDAEPDKRAEIYAKYQIADDNMRARLDAEWKTRLDEDATTMKLFLQLRQRIREQILKG